jgi:transcriptional regulator with XRE-family HTH domain
MNNLELKEKRKKLGLTQDDLGKKLGVSKRTIINYEKGDVIPYSKNELLHKVLNENPELPQETTKPKQIAQLKIDIKDEMIAFYKEKADFYEKEKKEGNAVLEKLCKQIEDLRLEIKKGVLEQTLQKLEKEINRKPKKVSV